MSRRSSFVSARDLPVGRKPLVITGKGRSGKFVCKLYINSAGIEVYAGDKGTKQLCNENWDDFVKLLSTVTVR